MNYSKTPWHRVEAPTEDSLRTIFRKEGLSPTRWSNGPGDRYGRHSHTYHKVLYCISGSITFEVAGKAVALAPGDRLDLAAGTPHSALVGPEGVVCLEAAR